MLVAEGRHSTLPREARLTTKDTLRRRLLFGHKDQRLRSLFQLSIWPWQYPQTVDWVEKVILYVASVQVKVQAQSAHLHFKLAASQGVPSGQCLEFSGKALDNPEPTRLKRQVQISAAEKRARHERCNPRVEILDAQ